MDATVTTAEPVRCLKCRRVLRRPSPDGYGPKCRRKIHRIARSHTSRCHSWQIAKACELLELGAVIPLRETSRNLVFLVVSDDGSGAYRTAATGQCNCPAGLRGIRCYHAAAAHFVAAA